MNPDLQALIDLQELDLRLVQLQARIKQIPGEIQLLERRVGEARSRSERSQHKLQEANRERRRLEGEVELLRGKLSRYRSQQLEVKSNREYQILLNEIGNTQETISAKEDEIIVCLLAIDDQEEELRRVRLKLAEEEKEISALRKELEDFVGQSEDELSRLHEERERIRRAIPEGLLRQYERIASVRNGVALAEVRDQACQGCHVKLRPQLCAELRTNQQIALCESCNRILYYSGP